MLFATKIDRLNTHVLCGMIGLLGTNKGQGKKRSNTMLSKMRTGGGIPSQAPTKYSSNTGLSLKLKLQPSNNQYVSGDSEAEVMQQASGGQAEPPGKRRRATEAVDRDARHVEDGPDTRASKSNATATSDTHGHSRFLNARLGRVAKDEMLLGATQQEKPYDQRTSETGVHSGTESVFGSTETRKTPKNKNADTDEDMDQGEHIKAGGSLHDASDFAISSSVEGSLAKPSGRQSPMFGASSAASDDLHSSSLRPPSQHSSPPPSPPSLEAPDLAVRAHTTSVANGVDRQTVAVEEIVKDNDAPTSQTSQTSPALPSQPSTGFPRFAREASQSLSLVVSATIREKQVAGEVDPLCCPTSAPAGPQKKSSGGHHNDDIVATKMTRPGKLGMPNSTQQLDSQSQACSEDDDDVSSAINNEEAHQQVISTSSRERPNLPSIPTNLSNRVTTDNGVRHDDTTRITMPVKTSARRLNLQDTGNLLDDECASESVYSEDEEKVNSCDEDNNKNDPHAVSKEGMASAPNHRGPSSRQPLVHKELHESAYMISQEGTCQQGSHCLPRRGVVLGEPISSPRRSEGDESQHDQDPDFHNPQQRLVEQRHDNQAQHHQHLRREPHPQQQQLVKQGASVMDTDARRKSPPLTRPGGRLYPETPTVEESPPTPQGPQKHTMRVEMEAAVRNGESGTEEVETWVKTKFPEVRTAATNHSEAVCSQEVAIRGPVEISHTDSPQGTTISAHASSHARREHGSLLVKQCHENLSKTEDHIMHILDKGISHLESLKQHWKVQTS